MQKKKKIGTRLWNRPIDLLMYADDIVLMSSSQEGLSRNYLRSWVDCKQWKLEVNIDNTKVCAALGEKDKITVTF